MSLSFSTVATGVVGVSVVHSLVPHHWLPFIVVGRRQNWSAQKTLSLLGFGATIHVLSTLGVALAISYLGHRLDHQFQLLEGWLPGVILISFGLGYLLASFGHHHEHLSEKAAASSLIVMLGLSPCLVFAPFFLIIGPLGLVATLKLAVLMGVLSVIGMISLGWLAMRGLNTLRMQWLENNETRIMGLLMVSLGLTAIFI